MYCQSFLVIKWGHGRYRCSRCQKTFTPYQYRKVRSHRYFSIFRRWVISGLTIEVLCQFYTTSARTLNRHFDAFLQSTPPVSHPKTKRSIWLKVDATHLGQWGCVTVYKAGKDILYWQFSVREYYDVYVAGLRWLIQAGYLIEGVTSDWHGSIVAAVQCLIPSVPHQRCLVHTQRLCQTLITTRPKTEAGHMLLRIVRELNYITNHYEVRIWTNWLALWGKRYGELIKERTYGTTDDGSRTWWYTHKNLRRAFRTLSLSQTHLFLYLDYLGLDKDTNGLEAEFTYLKEKLHIHRGLKRDRQVAFMMWYLYFKSR